MTMNVSRLTSVPMGNAPMFQDLTTVNATQVTSSALMDVHAIHKYQVSEMDLGAHPKSLENEFLLKWQIW